MRTSGYKSSAFGADGQRLRVRGFALALAAAVFMIAAPMAGAAAGDTIPAQNGKHDRPLKWSADKVSWDPAESLVVLNGNVKIVQGETEIDADNAQIFSTKDVDAEQKLGPDSVEKFVANGNVRIEIELGVATSERAVYFKETKILRLSGAPAKFEMDGGNTITGSTITVDRETGKISFDNAEAVIFSDGDL